MKRHLSLQAGRSLSSRRTARGFTLIEVLVAAVILAIGLLGVAGLQAMSLRNNQSAFHRSVASALAYELADHMRTNVTGANAGFFAPGSAQIHAACSATTGCSVQQAAQNSLAEWTAALAANLPMGSGFVCIDSTPDDGTGTGDPQCDGAGTRHTIKIWWDGDRDGVINTTAANTERLTINFQL